LRVWDLKSIGTFKPFESEVVQGRILNKRYGDKIMNYQLNISGRKMVVFGTGVIARAFCEDNDIDIDLFIDNDPDKQGKNFLGKPIFAPSILLNKDVSGGNCFIFIASVAGYRDIASQLNIMGFHAEADYVDATLIYDITEFFKELKGPLFTNSKVGRYVKNIMRTDEGKKIRDKIPQYRPWCKLFPAMIVILSDGSVTTCCMDARGEQALGNIYEKNWGEIWNFEVPRVLENGLYDLKVCNHCIGNQEVNSLVSLISDKNDYGKWMNYPVNHRYPYAIQIELMAACNYQCPCATSEVYKYRCVKPDLERMFLQIRSFLPYIKHVNLFNHGEPLLNSGFSNFIKKCRDTAPDLFMLLSTNGILMDEEISEGLIDAKVNQVIFSVHGGPGTENMLRYSKVNADYEKVINNIQNLIKMRNESGSEFPKVALKAVLFNWNDSDELMDQFRYDAQKLGLKPSNGSLVEDTYYWVLDVTKVLASKRFTEGSEDLRNLISNGEFQDYLHFMETCIEPTISHLGL
jgi:MoaA/NifB/PqqE/SkfB family radical SAM enzyme